MKKAIIFILLFVICATFLSAQSLSSLDNRTTPAKKAKQNQSVKHAIAPTNKDMYVANVNECFSMLPLPNSRQYVMHFHQPLREFA
jgi:hypothetical protein